MKTIFYYSFFITQLYILPLYAQKTNIAAFGNPSEQDFRRLTTAGIQPNKLSEGIPKEWYAKAVKKIDQMDYCFIKKNKPAEYMAYNKTSGFDFVMSSQGLMIGKNNDQPTKRAWKTAFNLTGITKGKSNWNSGDFTKSVITGGKLQFHYNHFDIEYLNDKSGLRQNFIINEKPAGEKDLTIGISLGKLFHYKLMENNKLYCFGQNNLDINPELIYDDLKVWDATGTLLKAQMKLEKNHLFIITNDSNAVYPITVDPLSHSPEWVTSSDGILPGLLTNLQLQIDALYGFSVSGLGDVNGDGYDDVAIGAPAAIDIIAGPASIVGAGAVFIYFGSPDGLSESPDKILRSSTPVANAMFGYSIAGGNVVGNTRNDIIIGAPSESYQANVSGFPATAHVTAGKVYVFRGEDMSSASPSPFLSVFLNGSTYFTNGILGVTGTNISSNALFGFSVAATDDLTGDGLGEVMIGSPGYAEFGLIPVRSGAAFVYYSGSLASNTPVKLVAPNSSLLGIPALNTGGLLFGFSVDGAGDYNQDGKPDVVVGAPAGVTLNLGNFLGGSAYVYKGTGSGISTGSLTQLKATPSLIGTLTNLFGFSVKGVKNINGTRNGNILVGAPSGNLISNVLNGLQLKAGSVNVFKAKTLPLASEIPAQTIQSPRNSSLFTILSGLNLNITALFGASMDNMLDVNCDGITDIIVGEPLSTSVGIVNANVVGGSATIFLGKTDGTYDTNPFWSLENDISYNAGINAGSLLGYSVAGTGHVRGQMQGVRCVVGSPGAALDFSSGIFNIGNTLGTLFGFSTGNNGLGKSYMFGFSNCGVMHYPDINVTYVNVPVPGNTSTNDVIPPGCSYGTPIPSGSNPSGGSINLSDDGSYIFSGGNPGVYTYLVPVCLPGEASPCTPVELTIYTLTYGSNTNPPVANTDIASTFTGVPVVLKSLDNDRCSNLGCSLNQSSVLITGSPHNGTASADPGTGNITYTSNAGFTGKDTLIYKVYDNAAPAKFSSAKQIITVNAAIAANSTLAADDYTTTYAGMSANGNLQTNDTDPEKNQQTVVPQSPNVPGKGSLSLLSDGSFVFVPVANYVGPVNFPYSTCDNGMASDCANGTLYIIILPIGTPLMTRINAFYCNQKNCTVQLNWSATQDDGLEKYIIEHSLNGLDWTILESLDARKNAVRNNYSYSDISPFKGDNYYRLILLDKGGSKTYSAVLNTYMSCSGADITVNPNPFTDKVMIYFTSVKAEMITINLYNEAGSIVTSTQVMAKAGPNQFKLSDLGKLPSGVYIVQVKTTAKVLTERLLK